MPHNQPASLALSRKALRVLITLNWIAGFLILALLIATIAIGDPVLKALGFEPVPGDATLMVGGILIMVVGIVSVPITHVVLTRLLAIVGTVGQGDPFIIENAKRLQTIGWAVLGLEVLHLGVGLITVLAATDIKWSFSFTRWIVVLLLFVLARVFEEGARMRAELEGTI